MKKEVSERYNIAGFEDGDQNQKYWQLLEAEKGKEMGISPNASRKESCQNLEFDLVGYMLTL